MEPATPAAMLSKQRRKTAINRSSHEEIKYGCKE